MARLAFLLKQMSLAVAIIVFVISPSTAQEVDSGNDKVVYIQFDDSSVPSKITSFNPLTFDLFVDSLRKRGLSNLVTLRVPLSLSETGLTHEYFEEALHKAGLEKSDRIRILIIGTHGETNIAENLTLLERAGGFGVNGAFGALKSILTSVGPMLKNNFHFSIEACSTFCGSPEQLESRLSGLRNEVSTFGVESFSVWGAINDLHGNISMATNPEEIKIELKELVKKNFAHGSYLWCADL